MTGTVWTWFLVNAPAPITLFHEIVWKIPWMLDTVYNMVSDPIVYIMILILIIALFIFKIIE